MGDTEKMQEMANHHKNPYKDIKKTFLRNKIVKYYVL